LDRSFCEEAFYPEVKAKEHVPSAPVEVVRRGAPVPPLPEGATLLSLDDVGGYLRRSRAAVRQMLKGGPAEDDEVGQKLRGWVVRVSDHRCYILREPFMDWYRSLTKNRGKQ
jgi:hypothetical protein